MANNRMRLRLERQYEYLWMKYSRMFLCVAAANVPGHNRAMAEDICSEVWCALWRGILNGKFSRISRRLFYRTLWWRLLDLVRHNSRYPQFTESKQSEELEDRWITKLDMQMSLNRMSPRQARIIHMRIEGRTQNEIARSLDVSTKTVQRDLSVVDSKLRESHR